MKTAFITRRILEGSIALMLFLLALPAAAQDYDPANPPEPQQLWKITTAATEGGYASGAGNFTEGTRVYLRTSAAATNFYFQHWLKDGEVFSTQQNFTYTVEAAAANFVAVWKFIPPSPDEPQMPPTMHHLSLAMTPDGACSFNRTSGLLTEEEQYVTLTAYPSQSFDFLGWYHNGQRLSESLSFNYLMATSDVTLTAQFKYNPVNPDEPTAAGEPTTVRGDADGDGAVDMTDAVLLTNHYLEGTTSKLKRTAADINQDGTIDATDAVTIVNAYLGN